MTSLPEETQPLDSKKNGVVGYDTFSSPSDLNGPNAVFDERDSAEINASDQDVIAAGEVLEIEPPPDGGLQAWTQAVMCHLVIFNTWGFFSAFGTFATYYENQLGFAPSALSWIGSTETFLIFFTGAFSGRALDAGYFRHTQVIGTLLQMLGIFSMSFANKYYQLFLSHGVCVGLAGGIIFPPTIATVATYFSKKRTVALAFCSSGAAIGGVVFPLLISHLLPRVGFGWMVRILGFVQFAIFIITFTFLKTRLPPRPSGPLVDWDAFQEAPFMLLSAGMFLNFLAAFWALFFVGTYAENVIGLSYEESSNFLIIVNCIGIISRIGVAYAADVKFGPLNCMFPMGFVSGIVVFCWIAVSSQASLYAFAIFYGLFFPIPQGTFAPAITSLTTDLTKTGARLGMGYTFVSFATLIGAPIGGALIERGNGDYKWAQIWAGATLMVGGATMFAARLAKTGRKLFMWA